MVNLIITVIVAFLIYSYWCGWRLWHRVNVPPDLRKYANKDMLMLVFLFSPLFTFVALVQLLFAPIGPYINRFQEYLVKKVQE